MLSRPVAGVTVTEYKKQFCGRLSEDGLGFVWQCNVFSHYILVRVFPLFPLLYTDREG